MLDDLYRDLILEHYRSPLGSGTVEDPDHRAEGQNPLCGDECSVALAVRDGRIGEVEYRGRGCSISVASGSMMAGEIRGRTLREVGTLEAAVKGMLQGKGKAEGVDLGDVEALEGVSRFPVRVKCALLPWTTLREALSRGRPGAGEGAGPPVTTEAPGEPGTAEAARAAADGGGAP